MGLQRPFIKYFINTICLMMIFSHCGNPQNESPQSDVTVEGGEKDSSFRKTRTEELKSFRLRLESFNEENNFETKFKNSQFQEYDFIPQERSFDWQLQNVKNNPRKEEKDEKVKNSKAACRSIGSSLIRLFGVRSENLSGLGKKLYNSRFDQVRNENHSHKLQAAIKTLMQSYISALKHSRRGNLEPWERVIRAPHFSNIRGSNYTHLAENFGVLMAYGDFKRVSLYRTRLEPLIFTQRDISERKVIEGLEALCSSYLVHLAANYGSSGNIFLQAFLKKPVKQERVTNDLSNNLYSAFRKASSIDFIQFNNPQQMSEKIYEQEIRNSMLNEAAIHGATIRKIIVVQSKEEVKKISRIKIPDSLSVSLRVVTVDMLRRLGQSHEMLFALFHQNQNGSALEILSPSSSELFSQQTDAFVFQEFSENFNKIWNRAKIP